MRVTNKREFFIVLMLAIACFALPAWATQKLVFEPDLGRIRTVSGAQSIMLDANNDWQFKGGNLVPLTAGTESLGTVAKPWGSTETVLLTATGAATLSGGINTASINASNLTVTEASDLQGGVSYPVAMTAGNYTATATSHTILFTNTSVARTLWLRPAAYVTTGTEIVAGDIYGNAGSANITASPYPASGDTISGVTALATNNGHVTWVKTGAGAWAGYK